MLKHKLNRRDCLLQCAAFGSLRIAQGLGLTQAVSALQAQEQRGARKETQWNEVGPFYKRLAPSDPRMRSEKDPGLPLEVGGRILDNRGSALPEAKIEIWQADHFGLYDLDGYRFRAALVSDKDAKYSFSSVMPGHYPARVCQHIHYLVTAPGHQSLITQLYFSTDPVFEGDPDRNYSRDPLVISRELVRPVTLSGDPKAIQANVNFDLVLERL